MTQAPEPNFFNTHPNPPKWPSNKSPINLWYGKLHAFIYALQNGFHWGSHPLFGKVKYLNIRVDTRNGNFLVFREADKEGDPSVKICPDELGLEYKEVGLHLGMQPMETAPQDRPILLKTIYGDEGAKDSFCPAKYTEWNGGAGHYGKVWELAQGRCIVFGSKDILGWYELPK